MNELLVSALENQLALLGPTGVSIDSDPFSRESLAGLQDTASVTDDRVTNAVDAVLLEDDELPPDVEALLGPPQSVVLPTISSTGTGGALFVLTNRVSPVALAMRVLLNRSVQNGAPDLERFLEDAGRCARIVGRVLQFEDKRDGIRALQRRSTAWPIGNDASKSLERFRWSFLLWRPGGEGPGPLAELGLAGLSDDGLVLPTERGIRLAMAPNPLLGEGTGWTLGEEQQLILREAVLGIPGERREIAIFASAVEHARGVQTGVDHRLRLAHKEWTENLTIAHRAAMLGRLRDLGVTEVTGWGPSAQIAVTEIGREFIEKVVREQEESA